MKRRQFIRNGSMAAASVTLINFPIFGKQAPSNKVVVAVMGVNSRGAYLAKSFAQLPNVEIAYICDVEEKAIQNGMTALKEVSKKRHSSKTSGCWWNKKILMESSLPPLTIGTLLRQ